MQREIDRARSGLPAGNFLCALALLCYTEVLGGVQRGTLARGEGRANFESFFAALGTASDARPGVVGGTVVGATVDLFTHERVLWDGGYRLIAGVDEVGRAAWAGPLVAAAVILPPDFHFGGIGDGKVLTAKQRERAHERVIAEATAWAICLEEAATINERGLHECNIDLLARAAHELKVPPDYVLVDGVNRPPDLRFPSEPIVRGDASSASIAAASIIAKVTRDRVMEELHATYPQYGFDRNRGYWSPTHTDALSRCGLTPVHRLNKGTKRWLRVPPLHRP